MVSYQISSFHVLVILAAYRVGLRAAYPESRTLSKVLTVVLLEKGAVRRVVSVLAVVDGRIQIGNWRASVLDLDLACIRLFL